MNNIWFTGDTHFGHTNIIEYCNRPFQSTLEMDETMIERWNNVVKPNDIVWHLGDFSFRGDPTVYFKRLNGTKYLVLGNHDHRNIKILKGLFFMVVDVIFMKQTGQMLFLSHYAHRVWPRAHHGSFHLFGHSHGVLSRQGRSMDVGVDCWNFAPISFEQVIKELEK